MRNKMVALLVCGLLMAMMVTLSPVAEATDPFTVSIDRTEGSLKPGGSTTYFLSITNNLDVNRTFVISVSVPGENFTATVTPSEVTILAEDTYQFVEVTITAELEADIGDFQNTFIYVDNGRGVSETLQITSTIEVVEAGTINHWGYNQITTSLEVPVGGNGEIMLTIYNTGTTTWADGKYVIRMMGSNYVQPGGTFDYTIWAKEGIAEFNTYWAFESGNLTTTARYLTIPEMLPDQTLDVFVTTIPQANATQDYHHVMQFAIVDATQVDDPIPATRLYDDNGAGRFAWTTVSGFYYDMDYSWETGHPTTDPISPGVTNEYLSKITNTGNDSVSIRHTAYRSYNNTVDAYLLRVYFRIQVLVTNHNGQQIYSNVQDFGVSKIELVTNIDQIHEIPVGKTYFVSVLIEMASDSIIPESEYANLNGKIIGYNFTAVVSNNIRNQDTLTSEDTRVDAEEGFFQFLYDEYWGLTLWVWLVVISVGVILVIGIVLQVRKSRKKEFCETHPRDPMCKD